MDLQLEVFYCLLGCLGRVQCSIADFPHFQYVLPDVNYDLGAEYSPIDLMLAGMIKVKCPGGYNAIVE